MGLISHPGDEGCLPGQCEGLLLLLYDPSVRGGCCWVEGTHSAVNYHVTVTRPLGASRFLIAPNRRFTNWQGSVTVVMEAVGMEGCSVPCRRVHRPPSSCLNGLFLLFSVKCLGKGNGQNPARCRCQALPGMDLALQGSTGASLLCPGRGLVLSPCCLVAGAALLERKGDKAQAYLLLAA